MRTKTTGLEMLDVIETYDGRAYIGQAEIVGGFVIVRTGLPGRPAVIDLLEVADFFVADEHPDVEVLA